MNEVDWKPLVGLTSYFDMALIPQRPWTLLIWGILQNQDDRHSSLKIYIVPRLYPMQDIACEHGRLKTVCRIDFTIWYGLNTTIGTKALDAIDLGHFTKTKMAATAV